MALTQRGPPARSVRSFRIRTALGRNARQRADMANEGLFELRRMERATGQMFRLSDQSRPVRSSTTTMIRMTPMTLTPP
jgi:hypothetical protein